jgi:iron complex transport system ATP-binding protein
MTLAAQNISVRLGAKLVLDNVTTSFAPGQITAIVGPNGAGKSTLLQCLAGLRTPDSGTVSLSDEALLAIPPRRRAQRLAYLPQNTDIAWAVDVRTLVGLGRTPYIGAFGLSVDDTAAVDAALHMTDTHALVSRDVLTLSGGERARVLMARALAGEPQWLLADEPLTGLDPGYQLDIADLLRRFAHDHGHGVIITLHDLHMALRLADRVIVLVAGRIDAQGPPAQALTADVLEKAYGVQAAVIAGGHGPIIDVFGRKSAVK